MKKADLKIILVWRICILGFCFVPGFFTTLLFRGSQSLWTVLTVLWITAAAVLYFGACPLRYKRLGYRLEEDRIVMTDGVLYRKIRTIPVKNIQFVSLAAFPLQRLFGLTSVVIQAAGGSIRLPGIPKEEAKALQEALLQGQDWGERP